MLGKLILLAALLLAGCGGGGGGSSGSVNFTIEPSTVSGEQYEGDAEQFQVATSVPVVEGEVPSTLYVVIADPAGVLGPGTQITPQGDGSYRATFNTVSTLTPGPHSGALQVQVCGDPGCGSRYGNVSLGYTIQVHSNTNLVPLTPLAGAGDWAEFGRDSLHSAYVPVSLDASKFTPRWLAPIPDHVFGSDATQVTTGKGLAFTVRNGGASSLLLAYSETDGSIAWSSPGPTGTFIIGSAALLGGNAYTIISDRNSGDITNSLWSVNTYTQATNFDIPFPGHDGAPGDYQTPVISGTTVLCSTGFGFDGNEGTRAFVAATGAQKWFLTANDGYLFGSFAADASSVYFYPDATSHALQRVDLASGIAKASIQDTGITGNTFYSVPVKLASGPDVLVNASDHLVDFDTAANTVKWVAPNLGSADASTPVSKQGVVYVQKEDALYALDESTGQQLWSWTPPGSQATPFHYPFTGPENGHAGSPLLTNNLIFLSTNLRVYAIDLTSHQTVWYYPHPGWLSLSANGILYINRIVSQSGAGFSITSDDALVAINLR